VQAWRWATLRATGCARSPPTCHLLRAVRVCGAASVSPMFACMCVGGCATEREYVCPCARVCMIECVYDWVCVRACLCILCIFGHSGYARSSLDLFLDSTFSHWFPARRVAFPNKTCQHAGTSCLFSYFPEFGEIGRLQTSMIWLNRTFESPTWDRTIKTHPRSQVWDVRSLGKGGARGSTG